MSSTKIKDLPDNDKSTEILDQLNDINEDTREPQEFTEEHPSSYFLNRIDYVIDAVSVFVVVFVMSNTFMISLVSKLPYISGLPPHSTTYNLIVSSIITVLVLALKYVISLYK